jgi:hypothetical protein
VQTDFLFILQPNLLKFLFNDVASLLKSVTALLQHKMHIAATLFAHCLHTVFGKKHIVSGNLHIVVTLLEHKINIKKHYLNTVCTLILAKHTI